MKRISFYILSVLLVLGFMAFPGYLWALDVNARVDKVQIDSEDTVQLQVTVDKGGALVDTDVIQDFQVIPRGTSTNRSYVNGVWSHKVTYSYILVPLKSGDLFIPALKVSQKKETAKTEPISILVSSQSSKIRSDQPKFFAKASISNANPVKGQAFVYTFSLFCGQPIADARLQPPPFTGFSAREIDNKRKTEEKIINGQVFQVMTISYLLLAEQTGHFTLSPGAVIVRAITSKSRSPFVDPFDNAFPSSLFSGTQTRTLKISSKSLDVNVVPLPPYEGNGLFSGLIGSFELKAGLDTKKLEIGESATLTFEVSGQGNIMDAAVPQNSLSNEKKFKVYEDTPKEEIFVSDKGYSGKKIFQQALVALHPGIARISGASLVYFDVKTQEYVTLRTEPFNIKIIGQSVNDASFEKESPLGADNVDHLKKEVELLNNDILDIRESVSPFTNHFKISFLFFVLMIILPLVILTVLWLGLRFAVREKSVEALLKKDAMAALALARKADPSKPNSWGLLHGAMIAVLWSLAGKKGQNFTLPEIEDVLKTANMDTTHIQETLLAAEKIDSVRFGAKSADKKDYKNCFLKISKLICLILIFMNISIPKYSYNSYQKYPGVFIPQNLSVVENVNNTFNCIAFCAKAYAGESAILNEFSTSFALAVREYRSGNFEKSALEFEKLAQNSNQNTDLFYNTANAWLKAGNLGKAILWYEKAIKISPHDPDLVYNLAYARNKTVDKQEIEFSVYDLLLFWKGYLPLIYVQVAAITAIWIFCFWAGACIIRKKRVFSRPGILISSTCLVLFVAAGIHHYSHITDKRAVIVEDVVQVRSGTSRQATHLFDLHSGAVVKAGEQKNGYIKIFWAKDKVGWIKEENAIKF